MKNYEILLIINPNYSDLELPSVLLNIFNTIKKNGGEVKEHKILGRRGLTYTIKRIKNGCFVLAVIEIEPLKLSQVDKELRLMPEILRFDISNKLSARDFSFEIAEKEKEILAKAPNAEVELREQAPEEKARKETLEAVKLEEAKEEITEEKISETTEEPKPEIEEAKEEVVLPPVQTPVKEEPKPERKSSKKANKVPLEDLDKKLDEILKEEVI